MPTDEDPGPGPAVDPTEAGLFALHVWSYRQGELVATMIHLGDRLGLYRALADGATVTADDLAGRTGLHERWLREWLLGQAAAGLVDSEDGERFRLTDVQRVVLADEDTSLFFSAGAFGGPLPPEVVDGVAEAFRTGVGLPYDALGPGGAHTVERMLAPWARLMLVPVVLPALDGVVDRLRDGTTVVDVGCGSGLVLELLAREFPASTFHGYDPSRHAVERARSRTADAGLDNVEVHHAGGEDLDPGLRPGLVLTFDCLHDMPRPDRTAEVIGRALAHDGTWLVKEIRTTGDFASDRRNPLLAMRYATSVTTCLSSACSEPGGLGLGTLGLPEPAVRELVGAAGFDQVVVHDVGDPANLYYEVRR
jgi:2-polyprenyl-3-methyl-5-hydroxy-6-metoxy-1,4-benzoquinol methylase